MMNQTWGEWYNANMKDYVPDWSRHPKLEAQLKEIVDILMEEDVAKHPTRKPIKRK